MIYNPPNYNQPYGQGYNPHEYIRNQMYGQFNPNIQQQPQFIVKQVSNIEEAKASIVDPVSTNLFIDFNTGKIYMKRMNNNGLSDFYIFAVEQNNETKLDPLSEINQRLSNIENKLGGNNVQSVPNNSSVQESNTNDATASNGQNEK